jgi:hypothetical protein
MTTRAIAQKIGAQGHKWLVAHVEDHPHWLSRDLSEDFGIDAELELAEHGLRGEILKVQIKSSERVEQRNGTVKFIVERRYLEYAESCRYPLIMVRVDLASKEAWYLWLQDWLLAQRVSGSPLQGKQKCWTEWVPEAQTVRAGLNGELKKIARWEGKSQLALSLADAMRAATAIRDRGMMILLAETLATYAEGLDQAGLNAVIDEAIRLGDQMRGTEQGNGIADKLFAMVRRCGGRVDACTVDRLVLRGESYSRIGLSSLALMYDEHFEHIASLGLPMRYTNLESRVAYYCAFREAHPEHRSADVFVDPSEFTYAGLRYRQPEMFWDKYANRGPSALLDYLVS